MKETRELLATRETRLLTVVGALAAGVTVVTAAGAAFAAGEPALGTGLATGFAASAVLVTRDVRRSGFSPVTGLAGAATAFLLAVLALRLL